MKTVTISILFALFCAEQLVCVKEGVTYRFTKNACDKFNPKFVSNFTCRLRFFNRTTPVSNIVVQFHPHVKLDKIRLDVTTFKRFATVYRPSLIIHYSEFICDTITGKGPFSHVARVIRSSYEKTSNFFAPCPKSDKIYWHNTTVDTSKFPQFVPVGEYRMDSTISTYMNGDEEFVFTLQSFGEVKPLGALEFKFFFFLVKIF